MAARESIDSATDPDYWKLRLAFALDTAEKERNNTIARVNSSQRYLKEAGYWEGGRVPFGYAAVAHPDNPSKRTLIIREREAAIARELAQRLADGELPSHLARELTDRGIPTATSGYRRAETLTIAGGPIPADLDTEDRGYWHAQSVQGIMAGDTLLGRRHEWTLSGAPMPTATCTRRRRRSSSCETSPALPGNGGPPSSHPPRWRPSASTSTTPRTAASTARGSAAPEGHTASLRPGRVRVVWLQALRHHPALARRQDRPHGLPLQRQHLPVPREGHHRRGPPGGLRHRRSPRRVRRPGGAPRDDQDRCPRGARGGYRRRTRRHPRADGAARRGGDPKRFAALQALQARRDQLQASAPPAETVYTRTGRPHAEEWTAAVAEGIPPTSANSCTSTTRRCA